MRVFLGVMAVLLAGTVARADEIPDVRSPVRFGFAYSGVTRAPAVSFSWGLAVDVAHVTRRLSFQVVGDADSTTRADLPDSVLVSQLGDLAVGAGLFYVTRGDIGFGFEGTASLTFDAQNAIGGGFATRAYLYPYYVRLDDAVRAGRHPFVWWARTSLAFWVMGRVNWTSDGNGGTLAFGLSVDLVRFFFVPYVDLLARTFK